MKVPCPKCGDSGIELTGAPRGVREPEVCDCNKLRLKRRYYDGKFLILIPIGGEDSGLFHVTETLFESAADAEKAADLVAKENINNGCAVVLKAIWTIRPK